MNDQHERRTTRARWSKGWIASLLLCVAVIIFQRVHTYSEPLENDIAGYAVIGHEMLRGRELYSDLWERKPPLLYAVFAGAECITGYGRGEILLINITAALLTLLAVFVAGSTEHGRAGGLIAATMWTLLSGDLFMQANQPNAEVLLNVWLTGAFALMLRLSGSRRYTSAILLGVFFTGATLIKHHVIITCTTMAIGYALIPGALPLGRRIAQMRWAGLVVCVSWLAIFAYFRSVGRLSDMTDVLFHQNSAYAGNLLNNLWVSLTPAGLFKPFLTWMVCPIIILLVFGFFKLRQGMRIKQISNPWKLWLAWAIGTWPAVVLPGHLFAHYYQLWIPVWCVATGWASAEILDRKIPIPNIVRYGTIAAAMTVLACRELIPYRLSADQWAAQKYRGGNYVQQEYLGRYLGQVLLKPDEQFWVLGDDNSLYFAAKRSPPSGLLYLDPLTDGDETARYNRRLVDDLERMRPALVILSPLAERLPPDAPVFDWIHKNYHPWPAGPAGPHYLMFVSNGSKLNDGRLQPK